MSEMQFQLIACEINIAGDRDNTVVRDQFNPVTYPEVLVLRHIHGGDQHVHSRVSVGSVVRSVAEERERLSLIYGHDLVDRIYPVSVGLPSADQSLPTLEEVEAAAKAAADAAAAVRAGRSKSKPTPAAKAEPAKAEPAPAEAAPAEPAAAVPDLSALPNA